MLMLQSQRRMSQRFKRAATQSDPHRPVAPPVTDSRLEEREARPLAADEEAAATEGLVRRAGAPTDIRLLEGPIDPLSSRLNAEDCTGPSVVRRIFPGEPQVPCDCANGRSE
jgi:hypothetical protein